MTNKKENDYMNKLKSVNIIFTFSSIILTCLVVVSCSIAPKRGIELQYYDYKKQEVEVDGSSLRFLISDIHFNEYLQDFYSNLDYDNTNYYYNFGVSFKLNDNSKQQVKIVVDSAFFVYPNLNKTQDIDLVDQDTKEHYGRFYTPIGALIIPKSHINDVEINLTIKVYEQSTSSLISNQHVSVILKKIVYGYEIEKTIIM